MALIAPPEELQMDQDLEETWPLFKQRFLLYMKAAGAAQWPNDQKVALFLTVAGPAALQLFNTFQLDPKEAEDLETVLAQFEGYCMPRRNEVHERFLFRTRLQEPHESIEEFAAELQHKSRFCNFGAQREALVRDQIVLGCRSGKIRQRLLQQEGLTLEDALRVACSLQAKEEAQRRAIEKQTRFQVGDIRQSKGPVFQQQQVDDIGQDKVPVFPPQVDNDRQAKRPVFPPQVDNDRQAKVPVFQQKGQQQVQFTWDTKDNLPQQYGTSLRKESYKTYI